MLVHRDLFFQPKMKTRLRHPFPVVQVSCGKKEKWKCFRKMKMTKWAIIQNIKRFFFYSNWSQWLSSPLDPLWIEVAKISHRKSPKVWETRQGYVGVWNDIAQAHAHALGHSMHAHPYSYAQTNVWSFTHTHSHSCIEQAHTRWHDTTWNPPNSTTITDE